WVVSLNRGGTMDTSMRGRAVRVPPGIPFIFSMVDEISTTRRGTDQARLFFFVSRDDLGSTAALLDAAAGTALATAAGRLLGDSMSLLVGNLPDLPPQDGSRLATATEAMLGACLAPSADRQAAAQKSVDNTLMWRVRRAVRQHLHSPSLGPEKVCREAAM